MGSGYEKELSSDVTAPLNILASQSEWNAVGCPSELVDKNEQRI